MAPKVLLVDDEPAVLEGLVHALRREPYELLVATSAAEALEILAAEDVAAVVSDEMMPGMPGTEFLRLVRESHPRTVRIVLTGHASVETAMKAIHEGWVYQFLHKPCKAADLAAALHYGLLIGSLVSEGEDPHVLMPVADQETLLASFGRPRPERE